MTNIALQAAGTAATSFSSALLESKRLSDQEEFDLKWSAASLYAGAADTVSRFPLRTPAATRVPLDSHLTNNLRLDRISNILVLPRNDAIS